MAGLSAGKALRDPLTGEILAYGAFHLGAAGCQTVPLYCAAKPIRVDRTICAPAVASEFFSYVRMRLNPESRARVVSIT